MECTQIIFSAHSLKSTINRSISVEEVAEVVSSGEIIMEYKIDKPYPSKLLLKLVNNRPVHVVVAQKLETLD